MLKARLLSFHDFVGRYTPWWVLFMRLCLGFIFANIGANKLMHLADTTDFFRSLGIPFPHAQAIFASSVEFIGGLFLMLGLATRIVVVFLSVIMGVAIVTAQLQDVHGLIDLVGLQEWDYLIIFGFFGFYGAGAMSVDRIIRSYLSK